MLPGKKLGPLRILPEWPVPDRIDIDAQLIRQNEQGPLGLYPFFTSSGRIPSVS